MGEEHVTPEKMTHQQNNPNKLVHDQVNPNKLDQQVNPEAKDQFNPNTKAPTSVLYRPPQLNPNSMSADQVNPSSTSAGQVNPSSKSADQVNPSTIGSDQQINPKTPVLYRPAQVNPSKMASDQVNPSIIDAVRVNLNMMSSNQVNPSMTSADQQTDPETPVLYRPPQVDPSSTSVDQVNPSSTSAGQVNPSSTSVGQVNPSTIGSDQQINPKTPVLYRPPQVNPSKMGADQVNPSSTSADQVNPSSTSADQVNPSTIGSDQQIGPETPILYRPPKVTLNTMGADQVNPSMMGADQVTPVPPAKVSLYKSPVKRKGFARTVDPNDPKFLARIKKPLVMGWRREVVKRTTVSSGSNKADVYYHPPFGKKLRSLVEVRDFLVDNDLTDKLHENNFSFYKECLGYGEPYELFRNSNPGRYWGRNHDKIPKSFKCTPPKMEPVIPKIEVTTTTENTPVTPVTPATSENTPATSENTPVTPVKPVKPVKPVTSASTSPKTPVASRTFARRLTGKRRGPKPKRHHSDFYNDGNWVTSFEDSHNNVGVDDVEIVNEEGELTGFEEWMKSRWMSEPDTKKKKRRKKRKGYVREEMLTEGEMSMVLNDDGHLNSDWCEEICLSKQQSPEKAKKIKLSPSETWTPRLEHVESIRTFDGVSDDVFGVLGTNREGANGANRVAGSREGVNWVAEVNRESANWVAGSREGVFVNREGMNWVAGSCEGANWVAGGNREGANGANRVTGNREEAVVNREGTNRVVWNREGSNWVGRNGDRVFVNKHGAFVNREGAFVFMSGANRDGQFTRQEGTTSISREAALVNRELAENPDTSAQLYIPVVAYPGTQTQKNKEKGQKSSKTRWTTGLGNFEGGQLRTEHFEATAPQLRVQPRLLNSGQVSEGVNSAKEQARVEYFEAIAPNTHTGQVSALSNRAKKSTTEKSSKKRWATGLGDFETDPKTTQTHPKMPPLQKISKTHPFGINILKKNPGGVGNLPTDSVPVLQSRSEQPLATSEKPLPKSLVKKVVVGNRYVFVPRDELNSQTLDSQTINSQLQNSSTQSSQTQNWTTQNSQMLNSSTQNSSMQSSQTQNWTTQITQMLNSSTQNSQMLNSSTQNSQMLNSSTPNSQTQPVIKVAKKSYLFGDDSQQFENNDMLGDLDSLLLGYSGQQSHTAETQSTASGPQSMFMFGDRPNTQSSLQSKTQLISGPPVQKSVYVIENPLSVQSEGQAQATVSGDGPFVIRSVQSNAQSTGTGHIMIGDVQSIAQSTGTGHIMIGDVQSNAQSTGTDPIVLGNGQSSTQSKKKTVFVVGNSDVQSTTQAQSTGRGKRVFVYFPANSQSSVQSAGQAESTGIAPFKKKVYVVGGQSDTVNGESVQPIQFNIQSNRQSVQSPIQLNIQSNGQSPIQLSIQSDTVRKSPIKLTMQSNAQSVQSNAQFSLQSQSDTVKQSPVQLKMQSNGHSVQSPAQSGTVKKLPLQLTMQSNGHSVQSPVQLKMKSNAQSVQSNGHSVQSPAQSGTVRKSPVQLNVQPNSHSVQSPIQLNIQSKTVRKSRYGYVQSKTGKQYSFKTVKLPRVSVNETHKRNANKTVSETLKQIASESFNSESSDPLNINGVNSDPLNINGVNSNPLNSNIDPLSLNTGSLNNTGPLNSNINALKSNIDPLNSNINAVNSNPKNIDAVNSNPLTIDTLNSNLDSLTSSTDALDIDLIDLEPPDFDNTGPESQEDDRAVQKIREKRESQPKITSGYSILGRQSYPVLAKDGQILGTILPPNSSEARQNTQPSMVTIPNNRNI